MKKILMGSVVLSALSLSIMAFQVSCTKSADAQTSSTTGLTLQNKVIYTKNEKVNGVWHQAAWIMNSDGTGQSRINFQLPSNVQESGSEVKLSPDGKKLFFLGYTKYSSTYSKSEIYSSNIDGSGVVALTNSPIDTTGQGIGLLNGVY